MPPTGDLLMTDTDAYRQAIESRPDEGRLWELRVSNKSDRELVSVLLKADKKHNILKDGFLDMTMQARADLIDFALEHNSKNRNLSRLASKLFFTTGAFWKSVTDFRPKDFSKVSAFDLKV